MSYVTSHSPEVDKHENLGV